MAKKEIKKESKKEVEKSETKKVNSIGESFINETQFIKKDK